MLSPTHGPFKAAPHAFIRAATTGVQQPDRLARVEYRNIGSLEVSLLGLGTSRLASLGSRRSKDDARALLSAAVDCGVNFIDTADTYGSTAAERWIGDLTHRAPEHWVIATKTGLPTVDLPGPFRVLNQPLKKLKQIARGTGYTLDPLKLRRNIERSAKRLRREQIEIFLLHLPPEGIANDDEVLDILRDAQQAGLLAEFGISSDNLATIRNVHDTWGIRCAETGITPAHTKLSQGELGEFDVIANHVMAGASQLPPFAAKENPHDWVGPRQRLLRHAAAVPGVKVVLTGTSNPQHLRENAAALEQPVSAADLITRLPGL